jgi:hypothetical protein
VRRESLAAQRVSVTKRHDFRCVLEQAREQMALVYAGEAEKPGSDILS